MNLKQVKNLGNAVGFTVAMDRNAVINALRNHGVPVSSDSSDKDIVGSAVSKVINDSKFRNRFEKIAKSSAKAYLKATKQDPKASADGTFDWGGLAGGVLSAGTGIFANIQATKAQEELAKKQAETARLNAESAIAQANAQIEIEKLRLAQAQQAQQPKNNTLLFVGIGLVGLLMVGGIIVVLRKK